MNFVRRVLFRSSDHSSSSPESSFANINADQYGSANFVTKLIDLGATQVCTITSLGVNPVNDLRYFLFVANSNPTSIKSKVSDTTSDKTFLDHCFTILKNLKSNHFQAALELAPTFSILSRVVCISHLTSISFDFGNSPRILSYQLISDSHSLSPHPFSITFVISHTATLV